MSTLVYRISVLLGAILADVPVGTNLGLFWLLWALISGRFLLSRGAVFPALADGGLAADAVRRSGAALAYGRWAIQPLVRAWQQVVQQEGRWHAHSYEGFRPVACDLVGFFRPHLSGCLGKHYQSGADKALPAIVLAVVAAVGSIGKVRLPLLRLVLRADPGDCGAAALQRRALRQAGASLQPDEVLVVDAGFGLADLLTGHVPRFVVRVARNFTARGNVLPAYPGRGRRPTYGERVRPLPRQYKGKTIAATPPDATAQWVVAGRIVRAQVWDNLVLATAKPGAATFRCVAIHDPRYQEPLVVATNLPVSAYALWCLYRDRWPIGVSREGHRIQSVEVRPRRKDSSLVAREAPWRENKTVEPSDNMRRKAHAQHTRLQRAVNADVASLHVTPVAETVDNVRRQQGWTERSPKRPLSPAGSQR
jgi:hypothetical protein